MSEIKRYYVGRKKGFRQEDAQRLARLKEELGLEALTDLRSWVRYDVQGLPAEHEGAFVTTVLSVPFQDEVWRENLPPAGSDEMRFTVELVPGQYDQRADSCAQCAQLLTGKRPLVKTATVYSFFGPIEKHELEEIQDYFINPVESRLARLDKPASLQAVDKPVAPVPELIGFLEADASRLADLLDDYGLAMTMEDLFTIQGYFQKEGRNPTETELRMIDTYWSDHCRHSTFYTHLTDIEIEDTIIQKAYDRYLKLRRDVYGEAAEVRPETLMDLGTIATKYLKKHRKLERLDESEEINACSVKVDVDVDGVREPWLFMFKNETHNHPTEIEPFGGASTCLGGAIRDPLSGRSYIYQGMRVSGAADPRKALEDTLEGKLPQRKICQLAAEGFASYGNQIGVPTGLVDEVYHPGYEAKRMEVGAVVAAAPASQVRRFEPQAGDIVLLVGGRTGRDGIGGATGSSKVHTEESLETSGAEVQKGNPVEERKIQRLFRRHELASVIKRCNDLGAGGVSVAVGELADGLEIDLDAVPLKYPGLDGSEVALAESQERMAVVIDPSDLPIFEEGCREENLEVSKIAEVTNEDRVRMRYRGQTIVDLDRVFLDTGGAVQQVRVKVGAQTAEAHIATSAFDETLRELVQDLNIASKEGLIDRFDATVGAGTVLFPKGGETLRTPIQTMAAKIPLEEGETNSASLFAYGFDPVYSAQNPYRGAYEAVVESVCKLMVTGARSEDVYLSLQEYFPSLRQEPERWGLPFQSVLGALMAQIDLEIPAIGGKDSMSGSFEDLDVPPSLLSFATTMANASEVISPEFKEAGHRLMCVRLERDAEGAVDTKAFKNLWKKVSRDIARNKIVAGWAVSRGGVLEGLFKMALGNDLGVAIDESISMDRLTEKAFGSMIFEVREDLDYGEELGRVTAEASLRWRGEAVYLKDLVGLWRAPLEEIYPQEEPAQEEIALLEIPLYDGVYRQGRSQGIVKPRVLVPALPGTNSEVDMARAFERAGGEAEILLVANRSTELLEDSIERMIQGIERSQIVALPGGFSFGDEPDGSGKFMAAFFRHPSLREALHKLVEERDGLILGISNGFQALVKMGLLPYGRFQEPEAIEASLASNIIGCHQSQYVYTRVTSRLSPWLQECELGQVDRLPISHGEGRFICSDALLEDMLAKGQIACQYSDAQGRPSMDIRSNPSGSRAGIEAISSPCGRILGKMGHNERFGPNVCKNVPGLSDQALFSSGVRYFS